MGFLKLKEANFWFTVEGIAIEDLKAIIEIVIEEIGKDNIFIEEKDIAHGNPFV